MLRVFNNKNPLIVIFFPIITFGFLYFYPDLTSLKDVTNKPLIYRELIASFGKNFSVFYIIFSVLFLSVNSIFFNRIIRNLQIVKSFGNIHGFIFLFLFGIIIRYIDILQISIAVFFFLVTLRFLTGSLRKQNAIFAFFNAGLALSAASFFEIHFLYLYPVIIYGLFIFRTVNFREFFTSLLGVALPGFFYFSIYFFVNSNFEIIDESYNILFAGKTQLNINLNLLISISVFIVLLLISSFYIITKYRTSETDLQVYYKFFFLIFITTIAGQIFLYKYDLSFIAVIILTSSVPLGVFFANKQNTRFSEILFDIFLLCVIFSQTGFLR